MARIHLTRAGNLVAGDLVLESDDDSLTTDDMINFNYDADELINEAAVVTSLTGHADIGHLNISHPYLGDISVGLDWDALVWKLII